MKNWARHWVDESCSRPFLHGLGRSLYGRITSHCAHELAAIPGVDKVSLRGGMVTGCRPGMSDLDFTLILADNEDSEHEYLTLERVRGTYRQLKARWKILGEPILTTKERYARFLDWAPAPAAALCRQLTFHDGAWAEDPIRVEPHGPGKLATALDHFGLALKYHGQWIRTHHPYARKVMVKEVGKAFRAMGASAPVVELPAEELLTDALWALDLFARRFPLEPLESRQPPAEKLVVGDWLTASLREAGFVVEAVDLPVVLWENFSVAEGPNFFRAYAKSLKKLPKKISLTLCPVTPAIQNCRAAGWSGWWSTGPGAPSLNLFERLLHELVAVVPSRLLVEETSPYLEGFQRRLETLTGRAGAAPVRGLRAAVETARFADRCLALEGERWVTQRKYLARL